MKSKLLFVCVLLLTSGSSADTLNYYFPTKYSLQIKSNGLLNFISLIPGTMISVKQMFNSKNGIRISAGISANSSTYTDSSEYSGYVIDITKIDTLMISLHATYIRYPYHNKNLYLYLGTGPFGTYYYGYNSYSSTRSKSNNFSIGLDFCLGVEWFFSGHFTLFTEYNVYAALDHRHTYQEILGSNASTIRKTTNYNVNFNPLFVGISIYLF